MITTEAGNFISYSEVKEALGLDESQLDRLLKEMKPSVYSQVLYGEKYVRQEYYAEIEAEYLKNNHKKSVIRQACGLIAVWDCLQHDQKDDLIAEKWSRYLNTRLTGADVSRLVYRFVDMRMRRRGPYHRPTDVDFVQLAEHWSDSLKTRISADDAEFMLGLYVQEKDFFEPLPMAANNA